MKRNFKYDVLNFSNSHQSHHNMNVNYTYVNRNVLRGELTTTLNFKTSNLQHQNFSSVANILV